MKTHERLLLENKAWAQGRVQDDPLFFKRLESLQTPEFLWVGCSDSRVPANEITGTQPGEIFVHRNIANMVVHTDLNLLAVLEYAVHHLKVKHIIVCGHYGCGGVNAALQPSEGRIVDHWIRHVRDIAKHYKDDLERLGTAAEQSHRLCELNVAVQVVHVRESPILLASDHEVRVHGWIYDVGDGRLQDLTPMVDEVRALEPSVRLA